MGLSSSLKSVKIANNSNGGIGIDLGLKDLAIVFNGTEPCFSGRDQASGRQD